MTEPINVILWDSGYWGKGGFSQPRLLSAVKNLELTGKLRIKELRYVKTDSELSDQLTHEPDPAYNFREAKRHEIQKSRVEQTAKFFGYYNKNDDNKNDDTIEIEENLENLRPITPDGKLLFIVICPPGNQRTRLIEQLLRLDIEEAALVIAPAVWTDSGELESIIAKTIRNKTRVVPFVPYRFSEAMYVLGEKKREGKAVEILSAEVLSGRYPKFGRVGFRAFISEFAVPVIDCVLHAVGTDSAIDTGSISYKEAQGRSPCILINAVHQNRVISMINISAISKFQQVNLTGTAFFAGERLNFTDAFRDTVFYDSYGKMISSESSRGHDALADNRNGYAELLSKIINKKKDLPTLESFRNTQTFIDKIFSSLTLMQKQQTLQTPFTF